MRAVERKARKEHKCVTCRAAIPVGALYVRYTAFKSDDLIGPKDAPMQFAECRGCIDDRAARRSGVVS